MSGERSEPVGSPVKVVKVCFAYVVKTFTGEVVKVCSGPQRLRLPYDVGPARVFLGEPHDVCGLGPASRVNG